MSHPFSTVIIARAQDRAVINSLMAARGEGPDTLSVPLYDALGVVTHYGCRADAAQDYRPLVPDLIQQAADLGLVSHQEAAAIGTATKVHVMVNVRDTTSPREQFDAAVAAEGLYPYDPTADLTLQ